MAAALAGLGRSDEASRLLLELLSGYPDFAERNDAEALLATLP
jgi:hypothetical protein